jgi:general secretion pathway protein K
MTASRDKPAGAGEYAGTPGDLRDGECGMALLTVLWVVALLAALALGFANVSRTDASLVRNRYAAARAEALANSGVSLAIAGLLDPEQRGGWRADGTPRDLAYDGGTIAVRVQDEAGKLDLNKTSDDILANLLRNLGLGAGDSGALVVAIDRWKAAREALWRGFGHSDDENGRGIAAGPFLALAELRGVPGFSGGIYDRVAPFLTVYSHDYRVDPRTAPSIVLRSLPGADPAQVEAYVGARRSLGPDPERMPPLTGLGRFLALNPLTIASITATSRTTGGASFTRDAVVNLIGSGAQPYRLLAWRRGP